MRPYIWQFEGDNDNHVKDYRAIEFRRWNIVGGIHSEIFELSEITYQSLGNAAEINPMQKMLDNYQKSMRKQSTFDRMIQGVVQAAIDLHK